MNASELKRHVTETGSNFFDKDSMRFFGDTMANYYVTKDTLNIEGETIKVYKLSRKRPVTGGLKADVYFRADTFRRVHPRVRTPEKAFTEIEA